MANLPHLPNLLNLLHLPHLPNFSVYTDVTKVRISTHDYFLNRLKRCNAELGKLGKLGRVGKRTAQESSLEGLALMLCVTLQTALIGNVSAYMHMHTRMPTNR